MKIVVEEPQRENRFTIKKALCLDFDGTIRRSKSGEKFIQGPEDVELIPGVKKLVEMYVDMGYVIIGVTNQGGVAWGFKTTEDVYLEVEATLALFDRNPFHVIIACPFDPRGSVAPFNKRSLNRKPSYGTLAVAEHEMIKRDIIIDWDNSLFVGDMDDDSDCAKAAGVPFMHIDDFLSKPHTFEINGRTN